jgi:lysyl-tRNA synthetase class 2
MKTFQKLKQNPALWERYWVREKVIDGIRSYFKGRGFHEVQTPLLLPTPSTEPFLEVFKTELTNDLGKKWPAFLPTSPEYALKKLLAAGSGSIFEITKSFRNGEGKSGRHNPEFTILEWYEVGGDYMSVLKDLEEMVKHVLVSVRESPGSILDIPFGRLPEGRGQILNYQGKEYDLSSPWEKISIAEAFAKYADIDVDTMLDEKRLKEVGKKKGYRIDDATTWEEIWNQIIANEIEPKLGLNGPTVLYDFPLSQAVLAKKKDGDPRFAERWEMYVAGLEIANCFSELTDADEQEKRCLDNLAEREQMGKSSFPMDRDFIDALREGMPESGGIAVGVDRLVMLLTDAAAIDEVVFFPGDELFT